MTGLLLAALAAQDFDFENRRPDEIEVLRTKTGYPLANNALELDLLFSHLDFDDAGTDDRRPFTGTETRIEAQVAFGVTDAITAELRFPYVFLDPDGGDSASGWGDVDIDLKVGVPGGERAVHVAIGGRLTVPTGDEERALGQSGPEFRAYVAASGKVGPVGLHAQPYLELEDGRRGQVGLSVAAEIGALGPQVVGLLGFNGHWEKGQGAIASITPGAVYVAYPGFEISAGIPLGLTDDTPDWGVLADLKLAF